MDLCSRKIVGWSMASTLHARIVVDALNMAIEQRGPLAGLIRFTTRIADRSTPGPVINR